MERDEAERSPLAPFARARAAAFTKTPSAVISPPKSDTDRTEALPFAVDALPGRRRSAPSVDVQPVTTAPSP